MKYILLVYLDEETWDKLAETEQRRLREEGSRFARQLQSSGQFLGGAPLHSTSTATSVRVRDGKRLVTDGPFAETKEHLGGYVLIDAKDRDEAIDIGIRFQGNGPCTIEVRPVMEIAGM